MLANLPPGRGAVLAIALALYVVPLAADAQTLPNLTLPSSSLVGPPLMFAPVPAGGSLQGASGDAVNPASSRMMTLLQVSFVGLQAMDVVSTMRAFNAGHTEGNPLMRGLTSNSLAMASVKAGAAASTLLLARHVTRKNRAAGVALMVAVNSALSIVVARNLRVPTQP